MRDRAEHLIVSSGLHLHVYLQIGDFYHTLLHTHTRTHTEACMHTHEHRHTQIRVLSKNAANKHIMIELENQTHHSELTQAEVTDES